MLRSQTSHTECNMDKINIVSSQAVGPTWNVLL